MVVRDVGVGAEKKGRKVNLYKKGGKNDRKTGHP
jgi:hypothetical protein